MKKLLSPLLLLCAAGLLSLSSPIDDSKLTPAEQEIVKAELPSYPLTTCLVSKRALDSGDGPFDLIVNGHLFRVCCPGCEGTARAKAAELRAAIARADREGARSAPAETARSKASCSSWLLMRATIANGGTERKGVFTGCSRVFQLA